MVWIEVTTDVTHQVNPDYPCVRMHFFPTDKYFWQKRVKTPHGESMANYVATDSEIIDMLDKRLVVVEMRLQINDPKALDILYDFDQLFKKHEEILRKYGYERVFRHIRRS